MSKRILFASLALLVVLVSICSAQQPQTHDVTNPETIWGQNSKWVQGVGPGYWPRAGTGLTLKLTAGTAFCSGTIVTYAGGTLTMTNSTTNYVYLNTASSCVPAVKTSAFTSSDIPVAVVVAAGGVITTITDDRTWFFTAGSAGYILQVNAVSLTAGDTVNFNDTTPVAGSNGLNIKWQKSTASTTDSVSAYVPGDGDSSHCLIGTGSFASCPSSVSIIASGTLALSTSAISSAACTSAQTASATGTLTTDMTVASFNGDPTGITGYVPSTSGMLTIFLYPTADTFNVKVCNNTLSSITPGAGSLNWRVIRGATISGTIALATGAIGSGACTSAQTASATGTLTTDAILASFNGDPTGVTGYAPTVNGQLVIFAYPTANTVNFKVCNNTLSSITPGAITLNWRVIR